MRKNKTTYYSIQDMIEIYSKNLVDLENAWFNLAGFPPGPEDHVFYDWPKVKRNEILLNLMWELDAIIGSKGGNS